ncbi:hypothetical protein AVEN_225568-1 [Araneus ventricosus]|uniref:Integrase catalytic domain-containing protein n=1 Tax=Araneus ventricosus TaxID=182803 RepID=A0A4Y2P418_ARAVE|nr:hypothetical protein AVEN_225568-1 [Araneus ventricosus]
MELKVLATKLPLDTIFQVCENTLLNMLKTVRTVIVTNRVIRSRPVFLELQFMPKSLKPWLLIFWTSGKKWIFLVEDTSTKWVELFALKETTAVNCAKTLVEEVFLRYGFPRRLISDNCPQFISAVMQQACNFLGIKQDLIPVYHPQANPSARKNRDLKPRLAILVRDEHDTWEEKLPVIRFALNTPKCETTNHTAAFLQFGRELRTTDDDTHDLGYEHTGRLRRIRLRAENVSVVFTRGVWRIVAAGWRCIFGFRGHIRR